MTNEELLNCLKIKYLLSNFDRKQLKKELIPKTKYDEFLDTLLFVLKTQPGYVFEIHDRMEDIMFIIKKKIVRAEREYSQKEVEIVDYFKQILSSPLEKRVDFKSQYESICKSQIYPVFGFADYSYKKACEDNYKNYSIYLLSDPLVFENDANFLTTINELISLYSSSISLDDLNMFSNIVSNSQYRDSSSMRTLANSFNKKATLKKINKLLIQKKIGEENEKKLSKKI